MEVFINGKEVQVPEHSSVLDSINISGTAISQLCKDPDMKPIGACRTCLGRLREFVVTQRRVRPLFHRV